MGTKKPLVNEFFYPINILELLTECGLHPACEAAGMQNMQVTILGTILKTGGVALLFNNDFLYMLSENPYFEIMFTCVFQAGRLFA